MNEDEKYCNKVLGIFVCFIYFFIALFVIFVIGISRVEAYDAQLSFSGTSYSFSNGNNSYQARIDYPTIQFAQYYKFTAPSNFSPSAFNLNSFNLYNVSPMDVSEYDYALINVITYPDVVVSSFYSNDYDKTYGYALSSNFTSITQPESSGILNNSYSTIIKVDLSSIKTWGGLFTFYFTATGQTATPVIMINYRVYFGKNGDDVSTAINNQTTQITDTIKEQTETQKETNEKLDKVNDSLTDSNVDGSMDSAGGFFNSFKDTDHGGLSGIITAPLVAINKMLSKECTALSASYEGTEFSVPSGCDFWSRIKGVQDFLNLVEGGMLCYLIIRQMYFLVQSLKDPEEDRVEVMDL